MLDIHPNCRKCKKPLSPDDLKAIEEQINEFYYPSNSLSPGAWHGLCGDCKANDTEPFVVS